MKPTPPPPPTHTTRFRFRKHPLALPLAIFLLLLASGGATLAQIAFPSPKPPNRDTTGGNRPPPAIALPAPRKDKADPTPETSSDPVPTELRSNKLEMKSTDEETRAICTGNVVLTGTNLKITCDRLEIIATRIGDKDETIGTFEHFKYILATGHVRIVQGDREATCGRAEVFPRDEKVVLTEAPVLLDHSNNTLLAATRITLLRGQREAIAEDVRLMAPPIQDLGANAKPEKK